MPGYVNGEGGGGAWTWQDTEKHINILELKAIHLQLYNTTALAYLIKMGGTKNLEMINLSQENKSQSRDLELFIGQTDQYYFRIPTRGLEHNSRHRITCNERF